MTQYPPSLRFPTPVLPHFALFIQFYCYQPIFTTQLLKILNVTKGPFAEAKTAIAVSKL